MSQYDDPPEAFAPVGPVRTSERVADAIRGTILGGRFRPGERLPPERTLARRFRVTRNTVREALRHLEHLRLVEIRQGRGVTVQDYLSTAGVELLAMLLGDDDDARALFDDILEARAVLGEAMLLHVARHADPDGLDAFEAAVEAFATEASGEAPRVRRLQDLEFDLHAALVRAGGNRAFMLVHNSLRHVYASVASRFEVVVADPKRLARLYRTLAAALRAGDDARARRAIRSVFRPSERTPRPA